MGVVVAGLNSNVGALAGAMRRILVLDLVSRFVWVISLKLTKYGTS